MQLLDCAIESAEIAGKILNEGFRTDFRISNKQGRNNLVTEYDHKAEEAIINNIKKYFPEHSILAEESGSSGEDDPDKILWVIDPLDGTVNYAHQLPIFSVSIAAVRNREILCGAIYNPIMEEMFTAEKGSGAFRNGERIYVSENSDVSKGFVVTGFPYNVSENPCHCIDDFVNIIKNGIPVRRLGSAALDLAYVASGIFDSFWEINLKPWDVAAGVLLVREAGGKVTQFGGKDYWIFDESILASNGKIHEPMDKNLCKC